MYLYKPKYFRIEELVSPYVFRSYGEKAWKFLDTTALILLDSIREVYGPMTVNNWYWGGELTNSGFREFSSIIGSPFSQHRFGRGFDPKPHATTSKKIREDIHAMVDGGVLGYPFYGLGGVENKVDWLHIDSRPTENGIPVFFNP